MTSRPSSFPLTSPGRLRLLSTRELLQMPMPEWLIQGIIPKGGVVGLYGAPGSKKSFIAIDMAMAVASGQPWQGHPTQAGTAIYIAAEGGVGITKRVRARLAKYQQEPEDVDIAWLTETVSVNNDTDDLTTVFNRIDDEAEWEPSLIIIDTLARCFDGDENTQQDMGRFIAGVDAMRLRYNATVIIVHHTNVGGARERGNTAFRGAADTMIAIETDQETGNIIVNCSKQKDAEEFPPIELMLEVMPEYESAVVVSAAQMKSDVILNWLKVGPLTFKDLKARVEEPDSRMSLATLKRKLKELLASGEIIKDSDDFYQVPS